MKLFNPFINFFLVILMISSLGCASTATKEGTGEYIDDSVITAKVKTVIFRDESLKSAEINVETFKGVVQLSGFVKSAADIARADKAKAEAKVEYYTTIEALQLKRDTARAKLNELKTSGEDAWDNLKAGVEKAWAEVKSAFYAAASKLNEPCRKYTGDSLIAIGPFPKAPIAIWETSCSGILSAGHLYRDPDNTEVQHERI